MENFFIIDGNSLINRAFYALPLLSNKDGEFSNAVYGFCNILVKLITENKVDYLAVAFDRKKPTFRHEMYNEYKGTRKGMPEELASQMPILKEMLKLMNIKMLEFDGFEADDIIGSLTKKYNTLNHIITGDKDALQLINANTEVWLTRKGITEIEKFNEAYLKEKMNLVPSQIIELKALMGDTSDNIPGVKGIGEKTALKLLDEFYNIENLYNKIENITGKLQEKLIQDKDMAFLSKKLATINTEMDIENKLENFKFDFPFSKEVADIFSKYEFKTLLKKENIFAEKYEEVVEKTSKITLIKTKRELENLVLNLRNFKRFSIVFDKEIHISNSKYEEMLICLNQDLLDDKLDLLEVLKVLKPILEDEKIEKICFDYKSLKHKLSEFNIDFKGVIFDNQLADYIIKAGRPHSKNIADFAKYNAYAENCLAVCLFNEYSKQIEELKQNEQYDLYFNIELPLIDVLFSMEKEGFMLNRQALIELNEEYNKELDALRSEICFLAGSEFNVNSPKQVAKVLFEDLKLKNKNKNSTNIAVLEDLEDDHPIITPLIRYRKIYKLNSTYVEAYLEKTDENNSLVHTVFNQMLTSTGRLSSIEPNLQNIPVREEEGRNLRKMFISRFENGKIISADYNQIELRLLAHFSEDEKLLDAYNSNLDIHTQTASRVFGVKPEEVTNLMRRKAKAVNFGIIYGISDFGLSKSIHSSRKEAKEFIDKYLETYDKVSLYMENSKKYAKENGYVKTLFNRRRYIDDLSSKFHLNKKFGERVALNMPLQGTASDIIKMAMINVFNKLNEENLKSKLILQIHDELIVDVYPDEEDIVTQILKDEMQNVVKLKVPLIVETNIGENLYEAK